MNFFDTNKGVIFTFELEDGNILRLNYLLQPNSLREKWINEVKTYRNKENTSLNLKLSNKNKSHLKELTEKLNSTIININKAYKIDVLKTLNRIEDVNRKNLNKLHEIFELYGENKQKLYRGEDIHYLWLELNEWIHIIEVAMDASEDSFPQYSAIVTVYPPYPGRILEERDKLFLSTEFCWGQLYLGYNTLGKDYLSVSLDNEVRSIINNQVKVQEFYSSEVWLCFQGIPYLHKSMETQFYQWYETLDQEAQELIPIENLNSLALGRYHLGRIMVNQDLLQFHPVEEDWYFDIRLQKRWNTEVFSKITSILDMEIYE